MNTKQTIITAIVIAAIILVFLNKNNQIQINNVLIKNRIIKSSKELKIIFIFLAFSKVLKY